MQLSLREARKLETRIQAKVNEGFVKSSSIHVHEDILNNIVEVERWLADTFDEAEESIRVTLSLISARASIRRSVQSTNERSGINTLISQRKELIGLRSIWSEVINVHDSEYDHEMTVGVLQRTAVSTAESMKASSLSSSMYGRTDLIAVSTISDNLHAEAEGTHRRLLRDIDQVEDKLAVLNATTKIKLESDLILILEGQELL